MVFCFTYSSIINSVGYKIVDMGVVRLIVFLLFFGAGWIMNAQAQSSTAVGNRNPLVPGYFADPTIKKFGDTYYLYATTDGIKLASGEPQVWISKDFVNWYNYEMDIPLPAGLANCWAPDVVEGPDGKYYYFQGNCQAGCNIYGYVSETPTGSWSRLKNGQAVIPVGTGKSGLPALDAQYILDSTGDLYSFFGTWCTSFGGMGWAKIDTANMYTIVDDGIIPITQIPNAFEAAFPLKVNDKYILMYSSGDCQRSSYAVRYSYSNSITGPYVPGKNNPILVTNNDDSVDGPGHHSVLKNGDDYYILYHRHDNPHSSGGEFRQVCADKLIFENDSTINSVSPTHSGVGYLGENQIPYENLVLTAKVAATSSYHLKAPATQFSVSYIDYKYLPEYAIDDNNGTMWKAGDNLEPHSLVVDLGREKNIKRVMIQFEYPTFYYQYKIEYSSDSTSWLVFADKTANRRSGSPTIDDKDINARYLKITVTGTEKAGMFAAIWNVKVYDHFFDIPAFQNNEITTAPGALSTKSRLLSLNIDTLMYNQGFGNLPNHGSLGGEFTKYRTPKIQWVDSVKSVYFDGIAYLILNQNAPSLNWNSSYTSSAWVYNPNIGNGECIMVWASRSNMLMSSYTAMMYGTGPFGAVAHGDGAVDLRYTRVPQKAQWHHIAVTFDGMFEQVYVDGNLNAQMPISLFVESSIIKIGTSGESTEKFSGYIANAQLYDYALSGSEVVALMHETEPPKVEGPMQSNVVSLDNESNFKVTYFPKQLKIELRSNSDQSTISRVALFAIDGHLIEQKDFAQVMDVKLSVTHKGLYVLVYENQHHQVFSEKVLVY